jgi:Family of unknown function (DUF6176)
MKLYAFMAPVQPNKSQEFRQFVGELEGSRKKEFEASRVNAGVRRETMFLQKTAMGEMVVVIQEAESQEKALESLRSLKDPFNVWYFQKLKDIHGIDVVGTDVPMNELLLDYRAA